MVDQKLELIKKLEELRAKKEELSKKRDLERLAVVEREIKAIIRELDIIEAEEIFLFV